MLYQIRIDREALKGLSGLSKKLQRQIGRKIDSLGDNPFPPGHKKLDEDLYRIRSVDFRIIYTVKEKEIIVIVLRVGDRKEIYRHIPKL
jgi:mRNA interferase RelE/StbE